MTQQAELMNKIDKIPPKYLGEVIDFLGYIQHKIQQEAQLKQCESNAESEQKSGECAINIPMDSNGKFILSKELLEEMEMRSPLTHSLSGILSGMGDVDLDKVRMERLAKHL